MGFIISYRHRIGGAPLGLGAARTSTGIARESFRKSFDRFSGEGTREMPVEMEGRYSWMVVDPMPAETEDVELQEGERERLMEDALPVIRPGDYFATVDGDSMNEADLRHGQSVVIRPGATVHEGDICAVWVEGESGEPGESMIRRVYRGSDLVRLVPASPHHRSAVYPAGRVRVQGVVVATLATQIFRR